MSTMLHHLTTAPPPPLPPLHDDAPPPSYEQICAQQPAAGTALHATAASAGMQHAAVPSAAGQELAEKAQLSTVIRVQELEIGQLRQDLCRAREQMARMAERKDNSNAASQRASVQSPAVPAKLQDTLCAVVGEEAEARRQKRRSRKGDIAIGLLCCVALLAVLALGTYIIVVSTVLPSKTATVSSSKLQQDNSTVTTIKPPSAQTTVSDALQRVSDFRVIGKAHAEDDNLCWAEATLAATSTAEGVQKQRRQRCNVFRRAVQDPRLYCAMRLDSRSVPAGNSAPDATPAPYRTPGRARFVFPAAHWRARPVIVLEDPLHQQRRRFAQHVTERARALHVHTLTDAEASRARTLCTEQSPFRFAGSEGRGVRRRAGVLPPPPYWALRMSHHNAHSGRRRAFLTLI